jgi:hypothetical protein
MKEAQHKVIITGTGRAGTTLMMQLLTRLELDTGFSDVDEGIYESCHAGMEQGLNSAPYIVKSTHLCWWLDRLLNKGNLKIDHAFIPIRDLHEAAASRLTVWKDWADAENAPQDRRSPKRVPGGLLGCQTPKRQKDVLARAFFELMHTITAYDIPHTLIGFPRLAHEPYYLYEKLHPLVGHISYRRFFDAFNEIVDTSLIHDFSNVGINAA